MSIVSTYGEQNVWSVGRGGLRGNCTEIYVVNDASYWEILNVVFISHDVSRSSCSQLEAEGVDVGVGLERVLAAADSSFDVYAVIGLSRVVDEFWPKSGLTRLNRIVLDHIRCACFGIFDGVEPSSFGAGYALRKLIRRCVVELKLSGFDLSLFLRLVAAVLDCLCCINSFLLAKRNAIMASFELELELFEKVLDVNLRTFLKRGSLETATTLTEYPSLFSKLLLLKRSYKDLKLRVYTTQIVY
ncbi:MAG: alanine--tRNA ligase-related protein [Candidatus Hodgkinia cicadicola]